MFDRLICPERESRQLHLILTLRIELNENFLPNTSPESRLLIDSLLFFLWVQWQLGNLRNTYIEYIVVS